MADVRLLIREEGRTARNLIAFNVPVGANTSERITRKPPSVPRIVSSVTMKRSMKSSTRVRSASTGRDKKSELQARYWAFLFENLQRAVDGIYQTCEEDENISECKEVILVLENYTRDFHSLIEWFKLKWAYESSAPPLRRTPLAWEVRKTSPCRMWNSSAPPKCSSPLQKLSPTSPNPVDQKILENKSTTRGKIINTVDDAFDDKKMKDSKNNVFKEEPKCFNNEKHINFQGRETERSIQREKSTIIKTSGKNVSNSAPSNKINGNITNKKSSKDNVIRDRRNIAINNDNKDTEMSTINGIKSTSQHCDNSSDSEKIKNKANHALTVQCKMGNSDKPTIPDGKNNLKYSQVSLSSNEKMRLSKQTFSQSTTSTPLRTNHLSDEPSSLPETPRIVRSKTTLNIRPVSSVNKTRPGSSVMFRRRPQHVKNENIPNEESNSISGSVEVLTKNMAKSRRLSEDGDGWQTVRGRYRRGSSHTLNMSTRFHRPTSAISLPALAMNISNDKAQNKTPTNLSRSIPTDSSSYYATETIKIENNKSTGCAEDLYSMSNDSSKHGESKKDEIHLINGADETNSTSMIAAVFKNEAELLEKRIQQFMAAQAERERIILEEERKTEEADSKRSKQLSDEEEALQRQIEELESSEIDIDTETDETDGEMNVELEERGETSEEEVSDAMNNHVVDDISLEDRYENMLEGMSWAERMDTLEQLQALVARHPGRALELHQKLSSPSRKRSLPETLRRYQAKQACAQHKRQKLLSEKSQRLRELLNKVEDVKRAKNQLTENKRLRMELKLKRAEENRTQHLLEVVRKAHDEDSKLKEIAFINELEAQNKRHDFMALCQEQEERLQGIHEERQRRQEEKAAKEAAAEVRRRALEAERLLRIQKMRQTRREREERVGKMQLEREKERQELAREKARDREERLSALHAAQLANQEELQKKIAQKQQESARRHGENIEHIRQRAVELSILRMEEIPPTLKSYPAAKQCSLCNVNIPNEVYLLSHLKGKQHLDAVKKMHDGREPSRDELQRFHIAQIKDVHPSSNIGVDNKAAKEKQKALKRRSRKLKQRITLRGQEWENSQSTDNINNVISTNKTKIKKNLKELDRLCSNHSKVMWSSVAIAGLERCLGEIARTFNKSASVDQDVFMSLNGFDMLTNLLNLGVNIQNNSHSLPNKGGLAVTNLDDHAQFQEATLSTSNGTVATSAIQLLCSIITEVPFNEPAIQNRLHDIIGFLVTGGLIERVSRHCGALIETDFFLDHEHESSLLLASYDLLYRLGCHIKQISIHNNSNLTSRNEVEQTNVESHFIGSLEMSEVAGAVGCLYATFALSHQKCPSPISGQSNCLSSVKLIAYRALQLLRIIGEIDLQTLQKILGAEGTSLQWRLISSHLIARFYREPLAETSNVAVTTPSSIQILTELFNVIGYFAVNNVNNQTRFFLIYDDDERPFVLAYLVESQGKTDNKKRDGQLRFYTHNRIAIGNETEQKTKLKKL
ncbi:hypothetical protein PV327_002459 [Microctonus hyperodae]|uniref:C2H2-type domain-containing protein n=1 Tax=Microctonus hyperodae TaxID=165561 RepID=A0AA39KP44_MICHY|nr:hypothetical protein PV327_002459 [Microctonus hyperodae]